MGLLIPDPVPVKRCIRCAHDAPLVNAFPAHRRGARTVEVYRCGACRHTEHVVREQRRAV